MKILYKIPTIVDKNLQWKEMLFPITVGRFEISWDISEDNLLRNILVSISGQEIEKDSSGKIDGIFEHLKDEIFRVVNYLSNKIYVQTGAHVLNPSVVFTIAPDLVAESSEEEHELKTCPKKRAIQYPTSCRIYNFLDLSDFSEGNSFSEVFSYIADANRVESPFLKFEQFYKVIEYFFGATNGNFDLTVSNYTKQINASYDKNQIKALRELRNRCIHPKARYGHVNQEDLNAVKEVNNALSILRTLVFQLIKMPPQIN